MAQLALWRKFPATEMQHDFGKYGITKSRINASRAFNNNPVLKQSVATTTAIDALTDAKLCEEIFGNSIARPTEGVRTDARNTMGDVISSRWVRTNSAGQRQVWEIRTAGADVLVGEKLARALGIPNNSVAVVDTDNGIIKKRMKDGPPSRYTMYYCINNVTRADSAGKANTHTTDGKKQFSGLKGIICKALVSDQPILIKGDNELNMKYNINNEFIRLGQGGSDGNVTQTWDPQQGSVGISRFQVLDPNTDNNITTLAPIVGQVIDGNNLDAPTIPIVNAFLKKRGGDQFTGWITKYALKKQTDPFDVTYWVSTGGRPFVADIPDISLQAEKAGGRLGDIFTSTGDFPYACFCIECLGVSVLFREQNKIIYIRRIEP